MYCGETNMLTRRQWLALAAACAAPTATASWAQSFPTQPVRILVGFAA
jgi:hypothetical protein